MSSLRPALSSLLIVLLLLPASIQAQETQDTQRAAQLWADFNHYVIISRPDLAAAAGQALLDEADNPALLAAVESGDYDNYENNLARAQRIEATADVAEALEQRIQEARIEQSRDEDRIERNIELLDDGQRAYRNAVQRLAGAGQFAAPQMLAALENDRRSALHAWISEALVSIGRPVAYPLATALPKLDPVTMTQVAQVLARLGEPMTLPYLKEVLEREDVPDHARQAVQQAYSQILQNAGPYVRQSPDRPASQLYLDLADMQYRAATEQRELPGYDEARDRGIVWEYHGDIGLVAVPVHAAVHGDVLTMRSARRALELDPDFAAALSRYLMANLRRENRLPEDEPDPSYDQAMLEPSFYTLLAGPLRQHDVLDQALADDDAALALDAIEALSHTAGTEALINLEGTRQPLLTALSYPDRRVRFEAARTLAQARPTEAFPEAHRVVPVLAEAVRQKDVRYALVLAENQETLNSRLADVRELGYEAFGALSLSDSSVRSEIATRPGIDLIVIEQDVDAAVTAFEQIQQDYKLGISPIVAIAAPAEQYRIRAAIGDHPRLYLTSAVAEADDNQTPAQAQPQTEAQAEEAATGALHAAIEQATAAYTGQAYSTEESESIALGALDSLRDIALAQSVYRIIDAEAALIRALEDDREAIARRAADVLALIESSEAQRALARRAFAESGELQIVMLQRLGDSANHHGNLLAQRQSQELRALVESSTGETAIAAARAHGALALPTANAVNMILDGAQGE